MADPVGGVEKIVKLALKIKEAVETARQNKEECREIEKRVARVSALLSRMQETVTGIMMDEPAMIDALEDLAESLDHALKHVTACQERTAVCLLCTAWGLSKQLRRVQDDISNKMMLGVFALNVQLTIVLATNPPPALPLIPLQEIDCTRRRNNIEKHSEEQVEENNGSTGTKSPSPSSTGIMDRPEPVPPASESPQGWQKYDRFSLPELKTATHQFSEDNLIGRGAFAAVYKGVLPDGLVVAIKKFQHPYQLSAAHINDEFSLLSQLQHKNIVKFIGYTREFNYVKAEETRFLIEEYMPNGSLDKIIYGSRIDWSSRFRIVEGIAHGLQYLHEQQIVHSDLKPNNILLDFDMNAKITDFGTARMLDRGDHLTTRDIGHLAGTMGYMSPEYIIEGILSEMHDVYSFGVILLETINGMCRSKPSRRQASIEWAWGARRALGMKELFDPSLCAESQLKEVRRCIEVGLLCTQFESAGRPTMGDILQMLNGEKELPTPKKPRYIKTRASYVDLVCPVFACSR